MATPPLPRIDISDNPALVRLAEETRESGRSVVLYRGTEELALLVPRQGSGTAHKQPLLADPDNIWAGYDAERVRRALAESAGAFRAINRETFLADLAEQRQQDSSGRPSNA